uniref:Uncharacterized protein n=1 Tax=Plectus sambesii TaxID=2011161 RepID=A0A914V752_9BILA
MLEDVDNLPKLSGKTVGELHEMELAFIQQRKDQPTCCTLDADVDVDTDVGVDMKSRTSSSLKEEMRASSPLNQALLSNCHSQSPDPVDSYWWKQENLLDSWVAPSFPSLSADVRDTSQPKNSRAQVAAEDGAASNKRTIIVAPNKRMVIASPNEEDDDLSPDVTI